LTGERWLPVKSAIVDENGFPAFRLERVTTVDQVADQLRGLIWRGELQPGFRLKEVALSKSFGVSRNTIRDAIRELIQDGLLTHEPHRGAVVRELAVGDVRDLYEVRRMLELKAVGQRRVTDAEIDRIHSTVLEMDGAVEARDWQRVVAADSAFHSALVALLRSPRMSRFFDQISAEFRFVLGILWVQDAAADVASVVADVSTEHREIYEAVRAGRRADARRALDEHLRVNEERALAVLEQLTGTAT